MSAYDNKFNICLQKWIGNMDTKVMFVPAFPQNILLLLSSYGYCKNYVT